MYDNLTLIEVQFTQPLAWHDIVPSESSKSISYMHSLHSLLSVCFIWVSYMVGSVWQYCSLIFKIPAHRGTETATEGVYFMK